MTDNHSGHNAPQRPVTMLESVESIREHIEQMRPPTVKEALGGAGDTSQETVRYRPLLRPGTAILWVYDDNGDSKERVRIRKSPFVIGRVEGDFVIPLDSQISSRHAEISCRRENEKYVWYLRDLDSTNGTFVRVSSVILKHGQFLMMGGRRYRFDMANTGDGVADQAIADPRTSQWQQLSNDDINKLLPSLVALTPEGDGERVTLTSMEQWIGSDPQQCSVILDDKMVSPRHARIFKDSRERWTIESARSLNGLWAQIDEVPLGNSGQFQCGEQLFAVKCP